ncbi:VOC family protein [Sporosarcina sp. Marseille-Q4063]|uniref:VOC family protein n=1 Tax=Sporosarcina sp. Marseille-Q4063 TaxID=2810514 RepID=UPI001BAF2F2D|nr:VOC family protein [Sporosarcina sp. Marseille-Q4063]QUW20544.1 VOC family protein [Sporosarcina sp. Marseille-Q4063]
MTNQNQKITPYLMFDGNAEEAMKFYTSIFDNAEIESVFRQENGMVMHATFTLNGQTFMAIDNSNGNDIPFTSAFSLFVTCETEQEIDTVFKKLAEDGKILMDLAPTPFSVKFAWVEDQYGVSWQLNLETETH